MPIIWVLVAIGSLLGLGGIGASKLPPPPAPTTSAGKHALAVSKFFKLAFTAVELGFFHTITWISDVAIPNGSAAFSKLIEPVWKRIRIMTWVTIVAALLIFAGFALELYWLSQAVAGILVFILLFLFITLHGVEAAAFNGAGKFLKGFGEGVGVIILILVSLCLIQFGVGDLIDWVNYALWGGYLFGLGFYVLYRLLGHKGFKGLTIMFIVASICGAIGLLSRALPTETANLLSQYNLLREDLQQKTDTNNANASMTFVVVKEPVGKYENLGKLTWWQEHMGSRPKTGIVRTKIKAVKSLAKDATLEVEPGTYRRLDMVSYMPEKGTDTFIRVAKPAKDGTVLGEDEFYIPLNSKVQVLADTTGDGKTSVAIPLVVTAPSVTISPDGLTCELVVPPPSAAGVSCIDASGKKFEVEATDTVTITASGEVDIGRGRVGPKGEQNYRDTTMDSPFSGSVGGLDMWWGGKKGLDDRIFVGDGLSGQGYVGVPTFRVIQSLDGMKYRNPGAFHVVITKTRGS